MLDNKGEELGNALQILFSIDSLPSEEMVNKIQDKQTQIIKIVKQLNKTNKNIRIKKLEASDNVTIQNYNQALVDYDKVISMQDEVEVLLKTYSIYLQEFIDLIKSLQYK